MNANRRKNGNMAVKEKNKLVQTDEFSRKSRPEIDETFLFEQYDTPGKVVMYRRNDTPGCVAIRLEKSGCRTSFKKTDSPSFFDGRAKRAPRGEITKKSKKTSKKVLRFSEK